MIRSIDHRVSRKQRHTILTFAIRHEPTEHRRHAGQFPETLCLIDTIRACGRAVDLLKRNKVGLQAVDHRRGAREVDAIVHPRTMTDVVGEDSQCDARVLRVQDTGSDDAQDRNDMAQTASAHTPTERG